MGSNLDRFKDDLKKLIKTGTQLETAMQYDCYPEEVKKQLDAAFKDKTKVAEFIKGLPSFSSTYQRWYSEALALLRQLLPDRVQDFVKHYEVPRGRKEITYSSYRIDDYLQGIIVTRGYPKETVVDKSAALTHMAQQIAIVKAAEGRFESSLYDIKHLVQADLLDSELESSEMLLAHKFVRAAGAVAGVVLERHLAQVCQDHNLTVAKKNPTISDFNDALKTAEAVDLPQWRFIQHLADVRNLCDHSKKPEPTAEQVGDLINGVKKVVKTVF